MSEPAPEVSMQSRQSPPVYSEASPSPRYAALLEMYRIMHAEGARASGKSSERTFYGKSLAEHIPHIARLAAATQAQTILDYGSGKGALYQPAPGEPEGSRFKTMAAWGDARVTCYDPAFEPFAGPLESSYDGVICTDVLEHIPRDDIPWVIAKLFGFARRFLYVVAATYPAKKVLPNGENAHCTLESADWWRRQMQAVSGRFPEVSWVLCVQRSRRLRILDRRYRGNPA